MYFLLIFFGLFVKEKIFFPGRMNKIIGNLLFLKIDLLYLTEETEMTDNRGLKYNNDFFWNQFLAELDVKVIKSGLAYEISTWTTLVSYSGDIFYRLYLPLSGSFRIAYPDGAALIHPGNLYLIPCATPLKYEGIEPCTHYWIHFVSKQLQTIPILSYPLEIPLEDFAPAVQAKFHSVFELVRGCTTFADAVKIKNTVTELLVPFLEKMSGHLPDAVPVSDFMKVVDYIDLQLNRNIEVAELSALVGMSRADFSAAFRKVFGVPPKQYISIRRLFHAKHLLMETALPIKEIALRCGYHDEFFFHRIFRKYAGIPPAKYRKYSVY